MLIYLPTGSRKLNQIGVESRVSLEAGHVVRHGEEVDLAEVGSDDVSPLRGLHALVAGAEDVLTNLHTDNVHR